MHRIDDPNAVSVQPSVDAARTPGYFSEGDPLTGRPATGVTADWLNSVQESIAFPIEQAGMELVKGNNELLLQAINVLANRVVDARYVAAGQSTPTNDIGPVFVTDFASMATWKTFTANGASFAGYASIEIGMTGFDGQQTSRAGWLDLDGGNLSVAGFSPLFGWAKHAGLFVSPGVWAAGDLVFCDNGDGTFRCPDLRGRFPRSWAGTSSTVDVGRLFGKGQLGQNEAHGHTGSVASAGAHQHNSGFGENESGPFGDDGTVGHRGSEATDTDNRQWLTSSAGEHTHTLTINQSGGLEARPVNTALMWRMKY